MTISPARDCDLSDAIAILHGGESPGRSQSHRPIAGGDLNADDLFVARQGDRVFGAVYGAELPGSAALVWPPRTIAPDATVEDDLMAAVLAHLGAVKIVQAFLTTAEMDRAGALTRAGFQHVTRVWEMRAATAVSGSSNDSKLDLTAYPAVDPIEFLDVLVRCHEKSLDCPELNGLRTPEELLTGYRECAPDPARWWLARRAGEAIGVLILGQGELVFVGVTPNCRGCGFGRELLHFARASATPLSLIVDARNTLAIRLYSSLDFATVGSREVFLLAPGRSAGGR